MLIFDLVDRYARDRGMRGTHPGPVGSIKFMARSQEVGGTLQDLTVPLELLMQRNNSGYYLFAGKVKLPDGTLRQNLLDPGTSYQVQMQSQFYQEAAKTVTVFDPDNPPPDPVNQVKATAILLEPGYAYPFPEGRLTLLRGSVHHTDGRGLAGATVEVAGVSNQYITDESGQWVLIFPDTQTTGQVTVHFVLPDGPGASIPLPNVDLVRGRTTGLAQPGLRGEVRLASAAGIPDARIEVSGFAEASSTDKSGRWWYYFGLNQPQATVQVTANLPDGRSLKQYHIQVRPRATVVVPTFRFS
jgi:hypothetical protein